MENKNLIDKAIDYIQQNPKDNLSLQSIASSAGFSLTYFDSIFKARTGYSPIEYSRVYKLTRCALELRKTQKTVLEIALDFGYESPESFTRAFKSFYSLTPTDYRKKYSDAAISWHDLSGRIAISHFKKSFPELKVSDVELALDFCFTHNPMKYAEDIIGMTVAETEILTLGDTENLEHFLYVSDYNSAEPFVTLVCETEKDAILYLNLLKKLSSPKFSIRRSMDLEWNDFDALVAKIGLTCQNGYDTLYFGDSISLPTYDGLSVRQLTKDDLISIKTFRQSGYCATCHENAIQIHFDGSGNVGMKPIGVFENGKLICLAMPTLDNVRELKKYDIGAIFYADALSAENAVELVWKYAINLCLKENALLGNANADDDDSPLGIEYCEKLGFKKVAKRSYYQK